MAQSVIAKTDTGEVQLTITVPQKEVAEVSDEVLEEAVKNTTVSGFRKGKAPKKIAREKLDKTKLYEQVLQRVISQTYIKALKRHGLKPILSPKVELLKVEEGKDWEFRAITCEAPAIDLGNYKEALKKALAPGKLWTPEKGKASAEGDKTQTEDEKTQKVIQALIEAVPVTLPEILIEEEVNHALSSLLNQANTLGLTIEKYLASIGKTAEQIKEEYRRNVQTNAALQLILNEVVKAEGIRVEEAEIEALISAAGDQKVKTDLNTPLQREHLRGILGRRKALEFLSKL